MESSKINAVNKYKEKKPIYEKLCIVVQNVLKKLLDEKKATYIDITSRVKDEDSFKEKISKSKYDGNEDEIKDKSGLRIITYTNSEVEEICKIIEDEFIINIEHSSNKKKDMDVDRFGYLSVHYVAKLKEKYIKSSEYVNLKDEEFEIQVRTLLQHTWSEIEHDRNYKFKGALPKDLKRRFYMIAGVLELVDKEFDLLTDDITTYSNDIEKRLQNNDYNIELSDTSISQYLNNKFKEIKFTGTFDDDIINEIKAQGIKNIKDIDNIYNEIADNDKNIFLSYYKSKAEAGIIGFVRDLMIINDVDKYFSKWDNNWDLSSEDVDYFKMFDINLKHILYIHDIEVDE